jgi:transcriptional regulator with XRE-family HTH domain
MTPPDAEITELPSSPGARLRREREARGLTQQQAAEQLTLDRSWALERTTSALGAVPKGHLRRYDDAQAARWRSSPRTRLQAA